MLQKWCFTWHAFFTLVVKFALLVHCFTTVAIQNCNGFSDSHVCENTTNINTNALILAVINSSLFWERESTAINKLGINLIIKNSKQLHPLYTIQPV